MGAKQTVMHDLSIFYDIVRNKHSEIHEVYYILFMTAMWLSSPDTCQSLQILNALLNQYSALEIGMSSF